jgi:hypothetical protein
VNLWAIWFFHKSPPIIKTFIIALVKLSLFDPSTTKFEEMHYTIMDKQRKLVIHYENFITIENNITSSPHCCHGCHHNLLMHEFYHCSMKVINLMFFVIVLGLPKVQTKGLIPSYSSMGNC